jgi:hypothetical protein
MFNHSPQPNVMFTRVAPRDTETDKYPKLIFSAIKPIKKGDELYICYSADESKLWFSPDYQAEGDHVAQQAEEPTWIPPMVEDDEQTESAQEDVNSASVDMGLAPVSKTLVQVDTDAPESDDKKYQDRKARKQSKREKKVKKPKAGEEEKEVVVSVVDESHGLVVNGSDVSAQQDAQLSVSTADYDAALARLGLIPEIAIKDDDIQREEAATEEVESSDKEQTTVAWKLVQRIRGPVEAQEEDEKRTGRLQVFCCSACAKPCIS